MEGPKWSAVLNEEDAHVKRESSKRMVQSRLRSYTHAYKTAKEQDTSIQLQCGPIQIEWINSRAKRWRLPGSHTVQEARDILTGVGKNNEPIVWCTTDVGDGAESFELQAWSLTSKKLLWKKYPVGPDLGLIDSQLVYLSVKNKLIYHELWICHAQTGTGAKRLYKEPCTAVNLYLERYADGRLKLIRDNSQDIEVLEIFPTGTLHHRTGRYPVPASWILPLSRPYGIEFAWQSQGLLVLKQFGKQILWKCAPNKAPKKLMELPAGEFFFDPYAVWSGSIPALVCVIQPHIGKLFYIWDGISLKLVSKKKPTGLQIKRFKGISQDGTEVYGILTYSSSQKPTKLLMHGYGAYGIVSNIGSILTRWAPLVQNGWAIGNTFVRGGGDHTDAWAKAGRLGGRQKTIQDFIALTQAAQHYLTISPRQTAIYGRSAGGLLVGDTLAKYPDGSLMSAVYAEVPYVDELRTTTNPDLPLTDLEANEFGNPIQRLEDFIQIGLLSPADSAATLRTPNVFVLTRTAEHDSQVFAYESVKWIRRLRAGSCSGPSSLAPKLCIVEKKQGHFTPPDLAIQQWALDAALLDVWMEDKEK